MQEGLHNRCRQCFFPPFFDSDLYMQNLVMRRKRKTAFLKRAFPGGKKRRNGKGRLTDEELEALKPVAIQKLVKNSSVMGIITIKMARKDLNSYQVYKQRQAIEHAFRTNDSTTEQESSYMRNNYSEEAWLFLNHLRLMISIITIEAIAETGKSKVISKDLVQTLRKI